MTDEEKNSIELDIEAKYVGRKEKEFLNSIAYAECLYILDTKNNYCDDIKNLSLLKIVDIIEKQSKEIEEYKECERLSQRQLKKQKNDLERLEIEIEELKEDNKKYIDLHYVPYEQYTSKLNELNKKWKDKIKAKIEELERDKNKLYKEQGNIEEIKIYSVIDIIKAEILRFKELLEEE